MRNVISTNAHVEVTDEYAEQVDKLLETAIPMRETYMRGDGGQKDFHLKVVSYDAPDGSGERWAVDYYDTASREVEESNDRAEVETRYEEWVRASATDIALGHDEDGEPRQFDSTDVLGVPGYDA